jgi:UDP-3-O-[3-hydroxymyristoyl] glucosamine N-acyltransferase
VPDYGGVSIGNRVEIGANTCVDRGTLNDTILEDDVKIDNLVHIAHNAIIKKRAYIIAGSIIQGSVTICEDAYIAPGAIIMNQKTVGRNSLIGMGAVVNKDVTENIVVTGYPAKEISTPIEKARKGL